MLCCVSLEDSRELTKGKLLAKNVEKLRDIKKHVNLIDCYYEYLQVISHQSMADHVIICYKTYSIHLCNSSMSMFTCTVRWVFSFHCNHHFSCRVSVVWALLAGRFRQNYKFISGLDLSSIRNVTQGSLRNVFKEKAVLCFSGLPPGFKLTEEILNAEKPRLPPPVAIHYTEKHVRHITNITCSLLIHHMF